MEVELEFAKLAVAPMALGTMLLDQLSATAQLPGLVASVPTQPTNIGAAVLVTVSELTLIVVTVSLLEVADSRYPNARPSNVFVTTLAPVTTPVSEKRLVPVSLVPW